jgi:hypothetical protein
MLSVVELCSHRHLCAVQFPVLALTGRSFVAGEARFCCGGVMATIEILARQKGGAFHCQTRQA